MQISASERSSVRSSGSLTAEMSGVCSSYRRTTGLALSSAAPFGCPTFIDKVESTCRSGGNICYPEYARGCLRCARAAQRQPSCARTYRPHGPWTGSVPPPDGADPRAPADVSSASGHAMRAPSHSRGGEGVARPARRVFAPFFVRPIITELVIGQRDARVRRQTKCIVCLGAAFPPKRRSVASFLRRGAVSASSFLQQMQKTSYRSLKTRCKILRILRGLRGISRSKPAKRSTSFTHDSAFTGRISQTSPAFPAVRCADFRIQSIFPELLRRLSDKGRTRKIGEIHKKLKAACRETPFRRVKSGSGNRSRSSGST